MNLYTVYNRYEIFAAVYMKLQQNAWYLVLGQNDMFCLINNYMADPKAYSLEISGPSLSFVVIYIRMVQTQTSTRVSHLGPVSQTRSD